MTENTNRFIDTHLIDLLGQEVQNLEREFQSNKAMLLTEEDLKCHLFMRLHRRFPSFQATKQSTIMGLAVHSAASFFDANENLRYLPDLSIIPPAELSILESENYEITADHTFNRVPLRTKGFEFGGDSLAIELKFCRKETGIDKNLISALQADFNKLKTLYDLHRTRTEGVSHILGAVVVFNKTDLGRHRITQFIARNQHEHVRIFYATGNVDFSALIRNQAVR